MQTHLLELQHGLPGFHSHLAVVVIKFGGDLA